MLNTVGQHDQDIVVGRQQIPGGNIAVRDEYPILKDIPAPSQIPFSSSVAGV
jgi:hypothetical protein